ncbi:MAG: peptide chain release factor 2 [Bacteriovoracaceae bacterium]|nr:peptide chain release factor 2 [Bacteriovoracaceae bacterium]
MNAKSACKVTTRNLKVFGGLFDLTSKVIRLEQIEKLELEQGFWDDSQKAGKIQKEKSVAKEIVDTYDGLQELYDEFEILLEYAEEDNDEDSASEGIKIYDRFTGKFDEVERQALLSEEADPNNAIVSINAGAGGTESCDWAQMLFRMITRWAERRNFKHKVLDLQSGDSAGIKSATVLVEGNFSYGLLKSEAGVHRLVRISPFDSQGRRHTSFASIFVSPEVDDDIEIEIEEKDLRIDVYRSGGAGGQSVNTTDSAVRITHFPSKIVVTCQNERSQYQNRVQAMKVLRSRLYEMEIEKRKEEQAQFESGKKEIAWGSQIRSYVLHPYKMVKDHRTDCEVGSAERVLDGDLDAFINSFLRWNVQKTDRSK